MTAPESTIADVYANLATELDEGEHPGITLRDFLDAIRETAPGVFAEAARDAGFIPGTPELDTTPVTRGELAAAALAADRARETIAMLGEDLIRQRMRAERAEAELAKIRTELEHAKSALAGDNEGVRLWMLDCGNLVDKHRKRADAAEAALAELRPVRDAETGQLITAERARILALAGRLKVTLTRPGNGPAQREETEMVPLPLLRAALAAADAPPERVRADAGGPAEPGEGDALAAFWLTVDGEEGDIILSAPCADTLGCLWSFRADGERVTLGELMAAAGTHTGMAAGKLHAELAVATGEDGTQYNNGHPLIWSTAVTPGGWVCAVPVPGRNPDGICGHPVESEPCPEHRDPAWRPE